MKKVAFSLVTMVTMSSLGFAGGNVEPVEAAPIVDEVSPFYVGLGLSNVSTHASSKSLDFFNDKPGQDETGDILLMAGYEFNPYIAVEGRYMNSVFGESSIIRDSWGLYMKPQYPVTEAFTLYALLGYGGMSADAKGLRIDAKGPNLGSLDDTGFQWGVGASYDLNAHFSIFFDYVNVANDMDADSTFDIPPYLPYVKVDSDALSVGVTYHF